MPIRQRKPKTTCSLRELLNWVAHDDFEGPAEIPAEMALKIFGDTSDIEQIEIAEFERSQAEEAALGDIRDALAGGELVGRGRLCNLLESSNGDWTTWIWRGKSLTLDPIDKEYWDVRGIVWDESRLKTRNGEFVDVEFDRADVLRIWKLPEAETKTASSVKEAPGRNINGVEGIVKAQEVFEDWNADQSAPASDRIVRLDHNSDPHKAAIATLDRLIEEFREDHRLDNELGAQKPALLGALEAGRKLLDDATLNIRIGLQLIVEPIKIVIEKYGPKIVEGTISGFAHAAMSAVLKLMGIG